MRLVLLILLAIVIGYSVFLVSKIEPGNYVKIYAGPYLIELNLLGFLALLFFTVLALYLLIRAFHLTWKMPKSFSHWRDRNKKKQASKALGAGYLSLIKGDWRGAEKSLTTRSDSSTVPYVNYLAAAQAAQEQGRLEQRDEYLAAAFKEAPKERLAIGLVKARLHQSAGQYELAEATLDDIADIGRKNAQYTAMLMQTYQETGQWDKASQLISLARKQSALPNEVLDRIANQSYSNSLKLASDKQAAWKAFPKVQRKRIDNVSAYAGYLIGSGESAAAEKLIRSTLKDDWSDDLVRLYGELRLDKPAKQLRVVEGWLMARPENAELNLAAGYYALKDKATEKAENYLYKAIELGQLPKAYSLLGEVFEASNESGKALQLYRSGISHLASESQAKLSDHSASQLTDGNTTLEGDLLPMSRA